MVQAPEHWNVAAKNYTVWLSIDIFLHPVFHVLLEHIDCCQRFWIYGCFIPETVPLLSMGIVWYCRLAPFKLMVKSCNDRHSLQSWVALFLQYSSGVFIISDNRFNCLQLVNESAAICWIALPKNFFLFYFFLFYFFLFHHVFCKTVFFFCMLVCLKVRGWELLYNLTI